MSLLVSSITVVAVVLFFRSIGLIRTRAVDWIRAALQDEHINYRSLRPSDTLQLFTPIEQGPYSRVLSSSAYRVIQLVLQVYTELRSVFLQTFYSRRRQSRE